MGKIKKFSSRGDKIRKIVLICAIFYSMVVIIKQQITLTKLSEEIESYTIKIQQVNQENDDLSKTIDNLHDLEYIEIIARRELGLVRDNEKVYIFSKQ